MKNFNLKTLIIAILIPMAVGFLSYLLSKGGMDAYQMVNQPALNPPEIVFPIVWAILYLLMGISSYMVYMSDSPYRNTALVWYGIQLFFNFLWSIVFFNFFLFLFAFIWLLILIVIIAIMIYYFYKIRKIAGYLQIPYLLWCCFAAYLNYSVYILNK